MSDNTLDFTDLPPATGYLLPSDPISVLDIDWGLLAKTLARPATDEKTEPEAPQLAD